MLGEKDIYALLDERGVAYEVFEHEAVFTVEAAVALDLPHAGPDAAIPCKNLFLRDDKKRAYFLVVAPDQMRIDLRTLSERLGSRRLSFASPADLGSMLGLIPGSVTPLGILNDEARRVCLVLDESLEGRRMDAHPLVNTATAQLSSRDIARLAQEHGNEVRWCAVGVDGQEPQVQD